jgi:hypothetical protein
MVSKIRLKSELARQEGRPVLLLVDSVHQLPRTGYRQSSACRVLSTGLGIMFMVPGIYPSGRPQISKGLLDEAAEDLPKKISGALFPFADQDIPIIGLEPSEVLTFRDEYTDSAAKTLIWKKRKNSLPIIHFCGKSS